MTYEQIEKRYNKAKANKQLWESHLRECYEYAMPQRNTIDKWSTGAKKRSRQHDSTAEEALEDYANRMVAQVIPPFVEWSKLKAGSEIPKEEKEKVDQALEELTNIVFNHINSSNLTAQAHDAFLDLGISTGALIIEEGDGIQSNLNFRAISLSELYPEKSSKGTIETVFREFKVPVGDIKDIWKNAKLTSNIKRLIKDSPTEEIGLIEGAVKEGNIFFSVLMYPAEKEFLIKQELEYNPYILFRESVIPGETIGRGRVMRQLSNIKSLNKMYEDYHRGLAWQANPLFTNTDDGNINPFTIQIKPGLNIPVQSNDRGNPSIANLPVSGNPQLLDFAIKNKQDEIRKALLSSPFGNIEETPVRTATEMSIRNADRAQSSLASTARIRVELLDRLIANCVHILKKAGKLPDIRVNGKEVKLKFVNPSTRQQDEAETAGYARFIELTAPLGLDIVAQRVKIEDFPVELMDNLGLPEKLKRTEEETAQLQQQEQEQLQRGQGGQQV